MKNSVKDKIKEYFYQHPTTKLRVRQIERVVRVPLPSAIRYTKELESERILQKQNIAGINLYLANRTAKEYLLAKTLFNINNLFKSGLIDFLIKEIHNPIIILFGSYSLGEDIENSDIDIYIETNSKKKINLLKYEKKLDRKIQLFIHKNLNEIGNLELRNNIINGFVLNGYLEVFNE